MRDEDPLHDPYAALWDEWDRMDAKTQRDRRREALDRLALESQAMGLDY